MQELDEQTELQRIGEIVVIGPTSAAKYHFIHSLCQKPVVTEYDIIFGRIEINSELALFVYGMGYEQNHLNFAWDLVAHKILGYIVLFDWYNDQSFEMAKNILDFLTGFEAPIVMAADADSKPYPIPTIAFRPGIPISHQTHFTFCHSKKPESVKRVLVSLLDMVITQVS